MKRTKFFMSVMVSALAAVAMCLTHMGTVPM